MTRRSILILGGTAEAQALALALGPRARVVLMQPDRVARDWPTPPLTALPGGPVSVVVDASHPFDLVSDRAARALAGQGAQVLRLVRLAWQPGPRDRWVMVRDVKAAVPLLRPGMRVFSALGREALCDLRAARDVIVFNRLIGEVSAGFPLRFGRHLAASPPFVVAEEVRILRRLRVDALILRNSGGAGSWPKLAAARRLGLPVLMIDRPRRGAFRTASTVAQMMEWIG